MKPLLKNEFPLNIAQIRDIISDVSAVIVINIVYILMQ